MKKIAIALTLFQLMGCAKQPAIVTNQNEINRLKAEAEKNYEEAIFWNVVAVVVSSILAFCLSRFIHVTQSTIDLEKKVEEAEKKVAGMKDEQAKFKHEQHKLKHEVRRIKVNVCPAQQAELKDLKRGQRCLRYEVKKLKLRAQEEDLNAC